MLAPGEGQCWQGRCPEGEEEGVEDVTNQLCLTKAGGCHASAPVHVSSVVVAASTDSTFFIVDGGPK
eukprot:3080600-Pyramimonas_sp.AAC.1